MLLLTIPQIFLIRMNKLYNLIHNCLSTPMASFRTTTCPPFLCPISYQIPPVLQHPSHIILHHRGLHKLQLLPTGNLQVTFPQPCNIRFLQKSHLRSLSQIHPLILVNIKVIIPQSLHSHLIRISRILNHLQADSCFEIGRAIWMHR